VPSGGYLVPDGMIGIEYDLGEKKAYRFFALEADRGTMPLSRSDRNQTSLFGKLAAYRDVIVRQAHKTHLGISTLFVLTLTPSQERKNEILRRIESQMGNAAATFLFKTVDVSAFTKPVIRLFFESWERAGLPPLRIDE